MANTHGERHVADQAASSGLTIDTLLTPATYAVLKRVPAFWCDEDVVKQEIAGQVGQTLASVSRRLHRLWALGLVEFRKTGKEMPAREVRKISKD